MQSRRDQVQAHLFVMSRLASGMLRAEPDAPDTPTGRTTRGTMTGLAVGVLIGLGVTVYGVISPGGGDGWAKPGTLVVVRESGARYLSVGGQLHPVLNDTSARLLAGEQMTVQQVSRESIADAPRGAPVGIVGAPDGLPSAGDLDGGTWLVCGTLQPGPTGTPVPRLGLLVDPEAEGKALTPGQGLLVAVPDGSTHLLWQGQRLRVDTANQALQALGYGGATPFPVPAGVLNALPAGPDLAAPAVAGRGEPGPELAGKPTRIGQLFEAAGGAHYLLTKAGLAPLTETTEDGVRTVVKVREPRRRSTEPSFDPDEVQSIKGSTRLEAKKQRRREGRELGRRRVPIITEAEFLARRESVERVMVVRQSGQRTQIGVLEDGVLVEHYVNKEQATSYVGNVYLGKVQNVLPSMEAAFVDIGKGRNAVLYAGEVNFGALGGHGGPRRIESVLKSGQSVLVQVSKDPIGHKGARLTSQISLPGRYLVYVPEGSMTGISRKLPENERARLKQILKKIVPDDAGVIVRTAAEGASEEELTRDVQRLQQQWEDIQKKAATGNAPALLYGEPDMTVRVVRDIFNEDFSKVIVSGDEAWKTIHEYVSNVAPDLAERLQRWTSEVDVFATYRIDEQLMKALDRKVWLPSGGSLVIDRTEAMVVIDVNTGKFVGQGGNLEETVTRNNIEAAEEIVRQLRLRDLGGIIVIDFIDMVLESNRDLVLRRLLECLGRDRTKHQVAEVTSLGLVQMTRKRVGQGLLESFSEPCVHCNGRGVIVHMEQPSAHVHAPVAAGEAGSGSGKRRRRGKGGAGHEEPQAVEAAVAVVTEPLSVEAVIESAEPVREEIEGQLALEVPGVEAPAEAAPVVEAPVVEAPAAEAPAAAPAGRPRRRAVRKATAPAGSPDTAEIVVLQAKAEAALEAALEAAAPAVAQAA
ncbi:type VII secretion protein EccB, partial [Kitasatospora sp. NPDC036755]|uniref:type VII secretion protein EccB n=1 Tax=Kitasatospora sp. NPDC036755 TaxID=3154600 RepID=UPI0033E6C791